MTEKKHFKSCTACNQKWLLRENMLYDPNVKLLGYQMNFSDIGSGLLYFNHSGSNCKTTFAIKVSEFKEMYDGPEYSENMMAENDCPMYCLRRSELRSCGLPCSVAFIREIMMNITDINSQVTVSAGSMIR